MATYAIYRINLLKSSECHLAVYDSEPAEPASYRLALERVLAEAVIPVYKTQKDKTKIPLDCIVKKRSSGITLLMLNNEKTKKYLEGKDPGQLTYHPGCYVIIDHRSDDILMAIERIDSFESKTDRVRDLLQEALNGMLIEKQMQVDIRARKIDGAFWECINERVRKQQDTITRVSFVLHQMQNYPKDTPTALINKLQILSTLGQATHAAKSTLHMEADKDNTLLLDQTQEDIANLVALCCQTGYDIAVKFKNCGLYHAGDQIRALVDMPALIIEEFLTSQTVLGKDEKGEMALAHWFDQIHQSENLHTDEEPIPQRRKTSRK